MRTDVNFKATLSQNLYFVKGVAILFVVIGHVIGNRKDTGLRQIYNSDIFSLTWLSEFIYTFHMPIFFIASGVAFAVFSDKHISYLKFACSKFKRLFVPLICWVPPFFVFQSLLRGKVFSFFDLVNAIIHPYSIFWFIHSLIFATFFAFFYFKVFNSRLIYLLLSGFIFLISLYSKDYKMYCYWNVFYAFGIFVASYLPKLHLVLEKLQMKVMFLILFSGISTMLLINCLTEVSYSDVKKIINGIIAMFLIYIIAVIAKTKPSFDWLNRMSYSIRNGFLYLGEMSMAIYLLHIYFSTGARVFLVKFGITQPSLHFVFGCAMATLGPIIVYEILQTRSKIFRYSLGEK